MMKRKQNSLKTALVIFSGLAGLAVLGTGLCGCHRDPGIQTRETGTEAGGETPKVTIYTWDQYLKPELLEEFKQRTGITVEARFYESSDEMVEGLKSDPGAFDIFICEDGYIPLLAEKRMMKPLDHARLANWKNLNPIHLNQGFDTGNQFTVPYLWGTTLLAYRKDMLPDPPHSWSIILDENLKNRISFLDDRMECYSAVLRTMGMDLPGAGPDDISKAADILVNLVQNHGMRLGGDNDVKQHLIDLDSWVSMIYSGDAARIAEENQDKQIGYFIPEEGATVWTDSFCLSSDSQRVENAYRFLDFMLEAESAAASANFLRYASPNLAAVPFIDKDLLEDETINPRPEVLAKCTYFELRDVDSKRMVNMGWRRVQDAWLTRTQQKMPVVNPAAGDAGVSTPD